MGKRGRALSHIGTPKIGTKRSKLIEMLCRKDGVTNFDTYREIGQKIHTDMDYLTDHYGFRIDLVGTRRYPETKNREFNVYRIVGRYMPDGLYIPIIGN